MVHINNKRFFFIEINNTVLPLLIMNSFISYC